MQAQNNLHDLSVNHLIDLLLVKAAELLKITDQGDPEAISRITSEMEEIHNVIKLKKRES